MRVFQFVSNRFVQTKIRDKASNKYQRIVYPDET